MDSKVPGINGIPPKVLKCVSYVVAPVCLFYTTSSILCFLQVPTPSHLKLLLSFPSTKKCDKNLPENYRPISLLPCINKIPQRVIGKRLYRFWDDNKILFDYRFGFRKGHDTSHALLNSIRSFLDRNENVLSLYLDLKKKHSIPLIIEFCSANSILTVSW